MNYTCHLFHFNIQLLRALRVLLRVHLGRISCAGSLLADIEQGHLLPQHTVCKRGVLSMCI